MDNVTTQSTAPATPPASTVIATVEATHSGDTVQAGVGVLAKTSGSEGSRVLTIINPATEDKQDTGNTSLSSIDGKLPALGQALATGSVPVVLPAAQITTLTPPAAITGFATEATLDARTGGLTETAPASDTASSGLNGRLQRIAQRLTSILTALGSPFQAGGSIGNTAFGATQSGTWTVQPGNTANTTAWKVDGSAVTQPVSAASLPLPTGAAAKVAMSVTALQVTASGDTTLVSSGTRKVKRIEASNSHASTALTVGLKVASLNSGATFGKKYLPAAGGLAVWVFPDNYLQVTSEAITANLSTAGQVEFTAYYE